MVLIEPCPGCRRNSPAASLSGLSSRQASLLAARQQGLTKEEAACSAVTEELSRAEENGAHMHARLRMLLARQAQAASASWQDDPGDVCRCAHRMRRLLCAQHLQGILLARNHAHCCEPPIASDGHSSPRLIPQSRPCACSAKR